MGLGCSSAIKYLPSTHKTPEQRILKNTFEGHVSKAMGLRKVLEGVKELRKNVSIATSAVCLDEAARKS